MTNNEVSNPVVDNAIAAENLLIPKGCADEATDWLYANGVYDTRRCLHLRHASNVYGA